jgi:hypothetical protein
MRKTRSDTGLRFFDQECVFPDPVDRQFRSARAPPEPSPNFTEKFGASLGLH